MAFGQMTRTIHYWTLERIGESHVKKIRNIFDELNSKSDLKTEDLKLWKGGPFPRYSRGWGFTKIKCDRERDLVVLSIKRITTRLPEISWILLDEGRLRTTVYYITKGKVKSI